MTYAVARLRVLSSVVEVVVPSRGAWLDLQRRWGRCLDPGAVGHPRWRVHLPAEVQQVPEAWWLRFTHEATARALTPLIGGYVLLHAAGLARPDGSVLGLVAPSGTGKSTAATWLAARGWGYVTDELLAIGPDLTVLPYPKPIAKVVQGPVKAEVGPDELGLGRPGATLRLAGLVLLARDPAVRRPRMDRLDPLEALVALVPQAPEVLGLDDPLPTLLRLLDRVGGLRRLRYAEISTVSALLDSCGDETEPPPAAGSAAWEPVTVDGHQGVSVGHRALVLAERDLLLVEQEIGDPAADGVCVRG